MNNFNMNIDENRTMILMCERCCSAIEPDDMYFVVFRGRLTDVHSQHIACGKCVKELVRDLHNVFNSELIDDCVSVSRIEVKPNDLQ